MTYRSLKSLFHQKGEDAARRVHEERLASPAALRYSYTIGDYQMFVLLTAELARLQERVWINQVRLDRLWQQLPRVAQKSYLYDLLVGEIQATNDIENIRSTRREIHQALEFSHSSGNVSRRFQEMALTFRVAFDSEKTSPITMPTTPRMCRELYNRLLGREITEEDRPDGKLFSKKHCKNHRWPARRPHWH